MPAKYRFGNSVSKSSRGRTASAFTFPAGGGRKVTAVRGKAIGAEKNKRIITTTSSWEPDKNDVTKRIKRRGRKTHVLKRVRSF